MEVLSFGPVFLFWKFFPKTVVSLVVIRIFGFDETSKKSALCFFVLEYFITSCKFPTSTSWLTSMKLLDINVLLPCQTSELNAIERRKVMIDCSNWDTFHLFNSLFKPKDSHLRIEHTNMFWCSFYDDLTMRIVNSDIVFQLKCIFYLHFYFIGLICYVIELDT